MNELQDHKQRGLQFLQTCIRRGLAHSFSTSTGRWVKPYPEVTGYLMSLFCLSRYRYDLVEIMAEKLLKLQRPEGGFRSFEGKQLFAFDTAQICRGFLNWYKVCKNDRFLNACIRGAEFLSKMQLPSGAIFPLYDENYGERISIGTTWGTSFSPIQAKCAEFLMELNEIVPRNHVDIARNICEWTLKQPGMLYTHPGAYALEGLFAMGYAPEVRKSLLESFVPHISEQGFLAYHPELSYAYVSGSVQIAILCAKTGLFEPAWRICEWAGVVQNHHNCGGLYQYANPDGSINTDVHGEINSWGTKYYVELLGLFEE